MTHPLPALVRGALVRHSGQALSSPGNIIDIHTHYFAAGVVDLAAQSGDHRWPHLEIRNADVGDIMCGSDRFRRVPRSCWDVAARLEEMDADGVDAQVISPVPITLTYWANPKLADELARQQNEKLAEAAASSGGRIFALGTVALQDTDLALEEMRRAIDELGLVGLEIGTTVDGVELDAKALRPFFEEAARRRLPLFVHPIDGAGATRCAAPVAAFGIGLPTDTAIAAYSLVHGGVLADLPDLRICLSHGGGAYTSAHARLRYLACILAGERGARRSVELDALARLLWADALVFEPTQLATSSAVFGADHLLLGSDYPFVDFASAVAAVRSPGAAALSGAEGANAMAFLLG
jgi:aminocarboxymuconate-semialdehyde decarboxylase